MPGRASAPTLDRMIALCELMGDPQSDYPVIHITGTNGKGSTVAIVGELLASTGLTVGTYTSPDLSTVNERISRNGEPISDKELVEVLAALAALETMMERRPTRFELLTAAAFRWFSDVAVDVAVVEVGLGGRWDATNVVQPLVSIVTNVSEDHLEVLGPTLSDVAGEKSGIVKPDSNLVIGETDPDLVEIFVNAAEQAGNVTVWKRGVNAQEGDFGCDSNDVAVGGRVLDLRVPGARYEQVFLDLHGAHQGDNAACALAATEAFFAAPLDDEVVRTALASVSVPGRLEVVSRTPLVLLDGAHNAAGAEVLAKSLAGDFRVDGPVVAVVGFLTGRDPVAMLGSLRSGGVDRVIACPAPTPRTMPVGDLLAACRRVGLEAEGALSVPDALERALSYIGEEGLVLVTGSLYVVGEARSVLLKEAVDGLEAASGNGHVVNLDVQP
jgi:dihydrofolate synthase / folylpolyglutamate synthase